MPPVPRKRKRPHESKAIQKSQAVHTYTPVIRPRKWQLSELESRLLPVAFLNDGKLWGATANCSIEFKDNAFFIKLLYRGRPKDKTGKRIRSGKFKTAIEAENNAFLFRYSNENIKCRERLDKYKTNIQNMVDGKMDLSLLQPLQEPLTVTSASDCPVDGKQKRKPSPRLQKSYAMSASYALNAKVKRSGNPMNALPSWDLVVREFIATIYVRKIQRFLKRRSTKRAAKSMRDTIHNQSYRHSLLVYLTKHISENASESLLMGGDDPEVASTYSEFDKKHVLMKARHEAMQCVFYMSTH